MNGGEGQRRLNSQWLVRDDRGGSLRSALQAQINAGAGLLCDAEIVHDASGLRDWTERRRAWRAQCADLLERHFEREALQEFLYATAERSDADDSVARAMHCELGHIGNALELLTSLRGTLGGHGPVPAVSRDEGRHAEAQPA